MKASETQEKLKDFGRRFEGRSTRSQHIRSEEKNTSSEAEESTKLRSTSRT